MDIENLSLRELQNLEQFIPGLGRFPSRFIATDYNKFIEILYDDIDEIIYLRYPFDAVLDFLEFDRLF
ncbi:MAG: hypothetical protein AAFX46_21225, partial [Cyanobacteria bacterium J06636_27]